MHDLPPSASDPRRRCLPLRVRDPIEHISRLFHVYFTSISRVFHAPSGTCSPPPSTGNHWQPNPERDPTRPRSRVPSRPLSHLLNLAQPRSSRSSRAEPKARSDLHLRHRVWTLALDPGPQRSTGSGSGSGSNARSDSLDSLAPSSPTPAPPAPPAHLLQLTYCLVLLETPGLPSEPHDDCLLCKVSLAVARRRSP